MNMHESIIKTKIRVMMLEDFKLVVIVGGSEQPIVSMRCYRLLSAWVAPLVDFGSICRIRKLLLVDSYQKNHLVVLWKDTAHSSI